MIPVVPQDPPPDADGLRAILAGTPDPDFRRAYKDLASARWAADPTPANRAALKGLLPMLLADSTTLDAVLARLFGLVMKELPADQLVDAMDVCAEHFTRVRPWDLPGSKAMA